MEKVVARAALILAAVAAAGRCPALAGRVRGRSLHVADLWVVVRRTLRGQGLAVGGEDGKAKWTPAA